MTQTTWKQERQSVEFEAVLHWTDAQGEANTSAFRARDISATGVGLSGGVNLDSGTRVSVDLPGQNGGVEATVRYCMPSAEGFRLGYDTLCDSEKRARYDARYFRESSGPIPVFQLKEFFDEVGGEMNRRRGVLCLLYNQRRKSPDKPGA